MMRSAAIYVGPDFVGDRWQHFRLQLRLNVVNLEYLTIYICDFTLSPWRWFDSVFSDIEDGGQV